MAFVKIAYNSIPAHCKTVIEAQSLQNSIKIAAADAHSARITFVDGLTQNQKDAFSAASGFERHMDHAGMDAVMMDRFM